MWRPAAMTTKKRFSQAPALLLRSAWLVVAVSVPAPAQQPIRSTVNLVNVAFTARDSRGALLDHLAKDDVEVFEDAVPQKIAFFARSVDVPLTLGLIVDASGSQDSFRKQHER